MNATSFDWYKLSRMNRRRRYADEILGKKEMTQTLFDASSFDWAFLNDFLLSILSMIERNLDRLTSTRMSLSLANVIIELFFSVVLIKKTLIDNQTVSKRKQRLGVPLEWNRCSSRTSRKRIRQWWAVLSIIKARGRSNSDNEKRQKKDAGRSANKSCFSAFLWFRSVIVALMLFPSSFPALFSLSLSLSLSLLRPLFPLLLLLLLLLPLASMPNTLFLARLQDKRLKLTGTKQTHTLDRRHRQIYK